MTNLTFELCHLYSHLALGRARSPRPYNLCPFNPGRAQHAVPLPLNPFSHFLLQICRGR